MNLNELQPAEGSKFAPKRVGRGIGSGTGKTSGKGHKGQNARSGGGVRPGFEGGQMPLYRRLPKRGFKNIFAKQYVAVNVEELNKLEDGAEVTAETLKANGIISKTLDGVKILVAFVVRQKQKTLQKQQNIFIPKFVIKRLLPVAKPVIPAIHIVLIVALKFHPVRLLQN